MSYGVFRSDLMTGTIDPSQLENVRYYDSGAYQDIENGNVVLLDSLIGRDLWKAVKPAATSDIGDIVILGTPEMMYDETKKNLDEFINSKDIPARGYHLVKNNKFSVTADALTNGTGSDMAVGNIVELQAGTKLKVVASATVSSTVVGKIIRIEAKGGYTWYVIRVTA